ncbi:hypothetical protein Godav_012585 [Gossypium davidsonii]|uniref:Phorbol-ester/DAG-type domain-containing protein n=1 Tax=Gossypium davidsonii TaxID=34287 RepID=A0A7J8RDW1_GOSDV|nr:hypothetical protein [Gossypium davidsonii]
MAIMLSRIIKSRFYGHRVFHTYCLDKNDSGRLDYVICHDEVNMEYGSYYCTKCNIILHVNCAVGDSSLFYAISPEDEDEKPLDVSFNSTDVLNGNDAGEATIIEHFKHNHYLILSDKCCDGCMLPILASFCYCSQCEIFLHKECAELPKMKPIWHHDCQLSALVLSDYIFRCEKCKFVSNGFAYKCNECEEHICLRCATLPPDALTCPGHEHPLLFYNDFDGQCSACANNITTAFGCKDCNYSVDPWCIRLPTRAGRECDIYLLSLTYLEDPKHWFYHCITWDVCANVKCVLGKYLFIKNRNIYKEGDHPHPLTYIKYYLECSECGEVCEDVALLCAELECNCHVHLKCI